jgi:putative Mg2+ transporter-C (MgtC) family protein
VATELTSGLRKAPLEPYIKSMAPTTADMLLRLSLAFLAGILVGWERENRGRPAGLRTLILVCCASAVAMILSEVLLQQVASTSIEQAVRADPVRLGAGILTGIGFLGAGTILRHENTVRGVTTAATIWFMAVTGLVFGSGQLLLGGLATVLAMIDLRLLSRLEDRLSSDRYAQLTVTSAPGALAEDALRKKLQALGVHVIRTKLLIDLEKNQKVTTCELRLEKSRMSECSGSVVNELVKSEGIYKVAWD